MIKRKREHPEKKERGGKTRWDRSKTIWGHQHLHKCLSLIDKGKTASRYGWEALLGMQILPSSHSSGFFGSFLFLYLNPQGCLENYRSQNRHFLGMKSNYAKPRTVYCYEYLILLATTSLIWLGLSKMMLKFHDGIEHANYVLKLPRALNEVTLWRKSKSPCQLHVVI